MLLLQNKHENPSLLFPILSSYNVNDQLAKFEKKISVRVAFQWNYLKIQYVKVCKSGSIILTSHFKLNVSFLSSLASVVEFLNHMKRNHRY